ncbi:DNA sulfur modification protein DndE [Salmonella enterica subsp. enterica serovar Westhampton]|uniref:DNA sulfur modification protein DndE n=1 Tax=Salmonella enterica TaxID=28901 RepID=A0A5U4SGW7_SALER|nr:DNA sulfur modification protein DndE [Salmonella enterica subsp. enterica serovar Aba]EAS5970451.1 DNA sulfur modification protein DndE [Salmonella enterica]EBX8652484.1 DNA sulfur modification protein DndE [Salmonella enterica subsp. enterica serovar Westhampton]EBY6258135.1 DNA sulfur modification protein DndE [Salmonella enterica subsp. enterica serovar Warnow]EHA8895015.1 DNA sulfur modification protein DndE [Salmonella enterica subsp. enterica]
MLPNRIQLSSQVEDQLKRLKSFTGINPNISARIAFFRSVESGYRFDGEDYKADGKMNMDKAVWLGDTIVATELILKMLYPSFDAKKLMLAWAAHVNDGISSLRNHKNVREFASAV